METPTAYELVLKRGVVRKAHSCYEPPCDLPRKVFSPTEQKPSSQQALSKNIALQPTSQPASQLIVKHNTTKIVKPSIQEVAKTEKKQGSKRKRGLTKGDIYVTKAPDAPKTPQEEEVDPCIETVSGEGLEAVYSGPFYSYSGFSNMNREIVFRMAKMGVKVKVIPVNNKVEISQEDEHAIEQLSLQEVSPDAPKIHGMTMPDLMGHKGKKILYTMIESSDGVHSDYAEKLKSADEIWVPSPYLKEMLHKIVPGRVKTMPLGVDHETFCPDGPTMNLPEGSRSFCFLSVFWWSWRKGYDILLRAFVEEFSSDDDVSLLISTKRHDGKSIDTILPEIQAIVSGANKDNLPSIILHSEQMKKEKIASLYRSCDAFILMSRGEGFGLPYFEAAASGLPVIATNCTGQSSFLNANNAWMVNPEGYKAEDNGIASRLGKWCRYYEGQKFPVFGEVSIAELRQHMRSIFSDQNKAKNKAKILRKKILSELTWDHAATRVIRRLREISEGK